MRRTSGKNPAGLVATVVGGHMLSLSVLVAVSTMAWFRGPSTHAFQHRWTLWIGLAVFFAGCIVSQLATMELRDGIRSDRWSDLELDALQDRVARPVWSRLVWCIAVAGFVSAFFAGHGWPSSLGAAYIWLPSALLSLRSALRKPYAVQRTTINWFSSKPLHSDHWGEPKAS